MLIYECTRCNYVANQDDIGIDTNVKITTDISEGTFHQLYCKECESVNDFRILINVEDEKNNEPKIICPACNYEHDGLDYVEDLTQMEGDFLIECENCEESFHVEFKTTIKFKATKVV